jgi:hypothetical protein
MQLIHPGSMRLFWVTTYMEVWQTGFTFMESIQLRHPVSHEWMTFEVKAPF